MIDVHVHLAALPDGKNGCYISPKMLRSPLARLVAFQMKLPLDDPKRTNEIYLSRLVGFLQSSQYVKQGILLALDGVYDQEGRFAPEQTEFLISNDAVLETVRNYPALFRPGVSVNPMRRDAIDELERCAAAGAALVKVLPNSQCFDPADQKFIPFWKKMAQLRIPLLSHVGYEFSLIGKDQSVGDPSRLQNALENGVTVIAAHGGSYGLFFYEKFWPTVIDWCRRYPNFYWEASALSIPNRVGMLMRLLRRPELHAKMLFGTDYPVPCYAYPALLAGHVRGYLELRSIRNPFDRHFRLLEMLGFKQPNLNLFPSRTPHN